MDNFFQTLKKHAAEIENLLESFLPQTLSTYTDTMWKESIHQFVLHGGKRIRPVLAMIMAKELGYSLDDDIKVFTSVELLHNYLLAHDDIIDQDNLRRGKPTLHKGLQQNLPDSDIEDRQHFGYAQAIIGGDVIYSLAQDVILDSNLDSDNKLQLLKLLTTTSQDVSRGWYKQFLSDYLSLEELSLDYIIQHNLIEVTSSYTFLFPLTFGQIIATGKTKISNNLRDFAHHLGILFQTGDDLIGIFGDPTKSGKSNDGDIVQGKKTVPMYLTYTNAPEKDKQRLNTTIGSDNLSNDDISRIKALVKSYGLEPTQDLIRKTEHTTRALLEKLPYSDHWKAIFEGLISYCAKRSV